MALLNQLQKLLGKKSNSDYSENQRPLEALFRVKTYSKEDLTNSSEDLLQLQDDQIDVILIKNVLPQNVCNDIAKNIHQEPKHDGIFVSVIGNSVRNIHHTDYQLNIGYYQQISRLIKQDYITLMEPVFGALAKGCQVGHPTYGEHLFPIGQLRLWKKGCHTLPHIGPLQNRDDVTPFLTQMRNIVNWEQQMSYFIQVKQAKKGGELILYQTDERIKAYESNEVSFWTEEKTQELNKLFLHAKLNLEAGDMIIFASWRIWHKITHVATKEARISLGGFLGVNDNYTEVYHWS